MCALAGVRGCVMKHRPVTERDFRMPEFRDANPEDYEFRDDGKVVRKDRWETGIREILSIVGILDRDFEISEVVDAVRQLAEKNSEGTDDE